MPDDNATRPDGDPGMSDGSFTRELAMAVREASSVSPPTGLKGRYEALRLHGQGGMGEVYLAFDQEVGRDVAYKVIQDRHAQVPTMLARFREEIRITEAIRAPGIVPIYASVIDEGTGRPAYVMEYVQGLTLAGAIRAIATSPRDESTADPRPGRIVDRVVEHLLAACGIVAHAHSLGYLHRDLKPSNLLIELADPRAGLAGLGDSAGPAGAATRVLDWGLACEVGQPDDSRFGSPGYIDPAARCGAPAGKGRDVYSLGRILTTILDAEASQGGLAPRRRALRAVAAKATAERPEERYPDAGAMAADLERFVRGDRVLADREPIRERTWRWVSRHRAATVPAVAFLVLGSIAVAGYARWSEQIEQARNREIITRLETERRVREMSRRSLEEGLAARVEASIERFKRNSDGIDNSHDRDDMAAFRKLLLALEDESNDADFAVDNLRTILRSLIEQDDSRQTRNRKAIDQAPEATRLAVVDTIEALEILSREFPETLNYRLRLAQGYSALGKLGIKFTSSQADAETALDWFEKSLSQFRALEPKLGEHPELQRSMADATQGFVAAYLKLGRTIEALIALDAATGAIGEHEILKFLKSTRAILRYQAETEFTQLPWSRGSGADHTKAIAMAEYMIGPAGAGHQTLYNAACAFALASLDETVDDRERARRADRASACLERLDSKGYFGHMKRREELFVDRNKDLAPICSRPDVQALLSRVWDRGFDPTGGLNRHR